MRIASTLLLLVLLSACTIGDPKPTAAPPPTSTSPAATAGTAAAPPSPSQPPALASRTTSLNQQKVTVSLNAVAVSGGVSIVTWSVRNDETQGVGVMLATVNGHNYFSDGQIARVPGSNTDVPDDLSYVDGVFLVDAGNRLRYLPARDEAGVCVCSRSAYTDIVGPGESASFSAVFKAVPDGLDTVTVSIPQVGAFTRIPVER